jgi:hypothetical protein
MAGVNKMMSQWIVSFLVGLVVFFNVITILGLLELKYHSGVGFSSRIAFNFTLVVILLFNYWIYIRGDSYHHINNRFKEPLIVKIVTSIVVIAYYFFSVKYFFYILENSPWRGNWN